MREKFIFFAVGVLMSLTACDLQPKIVSLPDSVGVFITERYPALLADPNTQPEIYNSAATDYGVYASPTNMYGAAEEDAAYIEYASASDYQIPIQEDSESATDLYGATPVNTESAQTESEYLLVPEKAEYSSSAMYGDADAVQESVIRTAGTKRVPLQEIEVVQGDTLYSLSRKYMIPVNDLAVMNDISMPFTLSVGQKLKVPSLESATLQSPVADAGTSTQTQIQTSPVVKENKPVISSNPATKLPTINARSASKFSWPVRGKILSGYGAKSGGLVNDGINISAAAGTAVRAAENGVVAYAGNEVKGMGDLIIVQHSDGWMTVYAHLNNMAVRRGAKVSVGQKIGSVGATGKVDRPQLHFEIRKGTKAYNPSSYLK